MAFDFGKFAGSLGQSLMTMGQGGQPNAMGGGGMAPLDLSWLQALFQKPHANDLLARYDQRQQPDPGMQMFMGHSNHLTGGY